MSVKRIQKITGRAEKSPITAEEAMTLAGASSDGEFDALLSGADHLRRRFRGNAVALCAIVNAKSGRCGEDCRFCAQSARYPTDISEHAFIGKKRILDAARRAGAAVLDQAYVACGRLDGFWEIRLKPWDVAAGVLLVREAGGRATDFEGSPDCLSGEFIVASNGRIHEDMLRVIREGAAAPCPEPVEGHRPGHRDDCIEI